MVVDKQHRYNTNVVFKDGHQLHHEAMEMAVNVFPTCTEVYVTEWFQAKHAHQQMRCQQECACITAVATTEVQDESCAWPSTTAHLPTPSPRSLCCTWRRPGCRRKNKFTLWYFYVVTCVTITTKDLSILLKPMLVMKMMTIWRQGPHFEVKEEMHHPRY